MKTRLVRPAELAEIIFDTLLTVKTAVRLVTLSEVESVATKANVRPFSLAASAVRV